MPHPVTLLTLQWGDVPLPDLCRMAADWGYDGLELACVERHLDVHRAVTEPHYVPEVRRTLEDHGLAVHAVAAHMVGQAVCDPIGPRHRRLLPDRLWGDGDAAGVRRRAAAEMGHVARVAAELGAGTVVGFTGSPIWQAFTLFPPIEPEEVERGYADFADAWHPILDVFDQRGVRFALEVHPTEIAYDYWTADRALRAIGRRAAFGFNLDPSHLLWQDVDPAGFVRDFADRIYHVDFKDTRTRLDGRNGRLGSHLPWGDERRGWDFVSVGHGDVDFQAIMRALNHISYDGPISVEWEDAGLDRAVAAPDALRRVRELTAVRPAP
ncbi:sugar phosphate isomerase/epimerase family protein [Actinomadura hibisca]|uniref:sugar phosphate isomerase/epimerase family protein n=1 Tax=Actinomadura hibisca TaxID=68565 RepID=UPI000834D348|nr:sugar phosphate isomerase/epimerase family protein [Actinomadura hibisca]